MNGKHEADAFVLSTIYCLTAWAATEIWKKHILGKHQSLRKNALAQYKQKHGTNLKTTSTPSELAVKSVPSESTAKIREIIDKLTPQNVALTSTIIVILTALITQIHTKHPTHQPEVAVASPATPTNTSSTTEIIAPPENHDNAQDNISPENNNTDIPTQSGFVTDLAEVLSTDDINSLNEVLSKYQAETSHQIAILVVNSLNGEPISDYALHVASSWKLGTAELNNGILIVLSIKDHELRIELGKGFENYISDQRAQEIIDNEMAPYLKQRNYGKAITQGVQVLMKDGLSLKASRIE